MAVTTFHDTIRNGVLVTAAEAEANWKRDQDVRRAMSAEEICADDAARSAARDALLDDMDADGFSPCPDIPGARMYLGGHYLNPSRGR